MPTRSDEMRIIDPPNPDDCHPNDHNCQNVSVFGTRMVSASQYSAGIVLDKAVLCDPKIFAHHWRELKGERYEYEHFRSIPSLKQCHDYFESRCFFVVASGHVRQMVKFYLIARSMNVICLCEVVITIPHQKSYLEMKSNDWTLIPSFKDILAPNNLFDTTVI